MNEFEQKIQDAIDRGDTREPSPERSRSEKLRLLLDPDHSNKELREPFEIQAFADPAALEKQRYVVRCDGRMLMAIASTDEPAADLRADELGKRRSENMVPYIETVVGEAPPFKSGAVLRTTVAELLAWTGEPVWGERCDACQGSGKVDAPDQCSKCDGEGEKSCHCTECGDEHTRECSACQGSGESPDEVVQTDCQSCAGRGWLVGQGRTIGYVGSCCLDMRRLSRLMSVVDGKCLVWQRERNQLTVRGVGWHAVLMGIVEGDGFLTAPRFGPAKGEGNYHYCPFCQVTHDVGDHVER